MTMKREGKVFLDSNIIMLAASFHTYDVIGWINTLYDHIYIHATVLSELLIDPARSAALQMIRQGYWQLFDPDNPQHVSDEGYMLYEQYVHEMDAAFRQLNIKKQAQGRMVKSTADLGEKDSIAVALLLCARIICSNDYDIGEVIADRQLTIFTGGEGEPELLLHDTLEDFCYYVVRHQVAERSNVRKFFKCSIQTDEPNRQRQKLRRLDQRLQALE
ncbi:hypothetical protein [Paenibacillus sp. WLX2291]|uniref:hypothetical protein n=1 Tax=Paenibacillus sp. WLX2291 TaxID=3296934 RepID=UPI003983F4BD